MMHNVAEVRTGQRTVERWEYREVVKPLVLLTASVLD